jgi:type II secretory pathway component GspD/PulD (secretin)
MKKSIFIVGALFLAGNLMGQDSSENVKDILKQLQNSGGAAVEPDAPADQPAKTTAKEAPAAVDSESVGTGDVDELLGASQRALAGGDFKRAQAGFEEVLKAQPENMTARIYLRSLLERDARQAELQGMNAISEAWNVNMVLRSYDVSSEAAEKLELGDATATTDVAVKFPAAEFPKGASALYQPKLKKLFVRNTKENLLVVEEILGAMDVANLDSEIDQVEIEAKFVEVSEGTLEELGFEWRNLPGNDLSTGIGDVTVPDGQFLFDDALRGGAGNTDPMPFSRPSDLGAGSLAAGADTAWRAFRFEDTFSAAPDTMELNWRGSKSFDLLISALDQSSGTDVLSAPRVVTKSGKEAVIHIGEMHNYPTGYEPNAGSGNIVHPNYVDWEEVSLGVELTVKPLLAGEQIEMSLNPKVSELLGWQTYDITEADSSYNWYQGVVKTTWDHDAIQAKLPIFRVREIQTEVTIANGATIGMGGLINETVKSFEDKVPLLGSLPLVGRLFRNEGERAIKRNLLMFVTAKKVEPTGRISSSRSFE